MDRRRYSVLKGEDMTIPQLAEELGISTRAVEKQIAKLQKDKRLKRIGPARGGQGQGHERHPRDGQHGTGRPGKVGDADGPVLAQEGHEDSTVGKRLHLRRTQPFPVPVCGAHHRAHPFRALPAQDVPDVFPHQLHLLWMGLRTSAGEHTK